MAPPPFVCSFHSWKQGYVPVLLRHTVLWNGLHKLIFHDNTVLLLTILFWKFVQNCHEKFRKKEVKNIKKKVNCNRSPTAKVYMFVKKKNQRKLHLYIQNKTLFFFICILQSCLCTHTKYYAGKRIFLNSWNVTLYHFFPELKFLINIGHPAPSNCQFPHSVHLGLVQDTLARYYSQCADEAYCTALVDQRVDPLPYHCLQMSFLHNVCRNMSMKIAQRKQQMQQLCKKLSFPWLEEKIRL